MASTFTPLDALQKRMLEVSSMEGEGVATGLIIFLRGLPGSGKTKLARQLKEIFPDDTQIFSISQYVTNWKPNTNISANSDELNLATAACKQGVTSQNCLSVFGINNNNSLTSVILSYKEHGCTLDLLLEDSGVVAECSIKTMDALEVLDFDFANSHIISKVILKSDCMREAFSELDATSDVLEVAIVPLTLPQPRLRLTTYGFSGTTHYDFPRDSDPVEVFEYFNSDPYVSRYRLSLLRPSTNRALALSSRVSLRMNDRGFLSLQYMIQSGNSEASASFVEFYCVPDVEESDDCGHGNSDTMAELQCDSL